VDVVEVEDTIVDAGDKGEIDAQAGGDESQQVQGNRT